MPSLSGNELSNCGTFVQLGNSTTTGLMTNPLGTPINQTFDAIGNLATPNPGTYETHDLVVGSGRDWIVHGDVGGPRGV